MFRKAPALLVSLLLAGCGSTVAVTSNGVPMGSGDLGGAFVPGQSTSTAPGATGGLGTSTTAAGTAVGGSLPGSSGSGSLRPGQVSAGTGTGTVRPGSTGTVGAGGSNITTPITVGMVKTSSAGASSVGLKLDNSYSEQQFYDALIGALNVRGGLAGRQIKPVYDEVDPLGNNWAQDYAEACAKFTQDAKVELVLGYVFNHDQAFEECLARRGIPHLSTTFNVPDETELNRYPLLLNLEVPTITRRTLAKLDGAFATGALTKSSRVGVAYDSCPGTERSYQGPVKKAFAKYGVDVAAEYKVTCVTGQSDSGRSSADIQNMGLQFRSAGVTHVFFHSVSEGPMMIFFMQNAEQQKYYPTYVMSSLANLLTVTTNPQLAPPSQARNVKAYGWMPFEDVTMDKYPAKNAAQLRCLQLFKSKSIVPKTSIDYKIAYTTCEAFFIAERGLQASHGRTGAALIQGVQSLGTGYESATKLGGFAAFGRERHDSVLKVRPLVWVDACSCFDYTGVVRDIPS